MTKLNGLWDNYPIITDLPITQSDINDRLPVKDLADAYTEVEKWDLVVVETIIYKGDNMELMIVSHPASEYMPGGQIHNGFQPVPCVSNLKLCDECLSVFNGKKPDHPDNGCNFGIVHNILCS